MTQTVATKQELEKPAVAETTVFLKPFNEKQELNYVETFVGTPDQIISRSIQIIEGLTTVLTLGTFSVKIESSDLSQAVFVDARNLYDLDFNAIGETADFINARLK